MPMTITSTAFQANEHIPPIYTFDGENINPPLTFSEVPTEAESLVLLVDDPDAPGGTFTHWLLYDMSPATMQILQNAVPDTGKQGINDFKMLGYGGPRPPSGIHRYVFTLHALDSRPELPAGVVRSDVDAVLDGNIIATAQLVGLYEKPDVAQGSYAGQKSRIDTDSEDLPSGNANTQLHLINLQY